MPNADNKKEDCNNKPRIPNFEKALSKAKPIAKKSFGATVGAVKRSAPIASTVSIIGGLVADVLTPIAAIATWLFWFLLLLTAIVGYVWFVRKKKPFLEKLNQKNLSTAQISENIQSNKWCISFGFLAVTTSVMSLVLLIQTFLGSDDKGALASSFPVVAALQEKLFDIEEGVSEVRKTAQEIQKGQGDIKKDTEKILEGVGKVVGIVNEISEEMVEIKGLAGLIADPKTFAEFAHNLKLNFQNENYGKALKISHRLSAIGHDFYDLHQLHEILLSKAGLSESEIEKYFHEDYPNGNGRKYALYAKAQKEVQHIVDRYNNRLAVKDLQKRVLIDFDTAIKPYNQLLESYPKDIRIHLDRLQLCWLIVFKYWDQSIDPRPLLIRPSDFNISAADFSLKAISTAHKLHQDLSEIIISAKVGLEATRIAVKYEDEVRSLFSDATSLKNSFFWSEFDPAKNFKNWDNFLLGRGWSGVFENWQKYYSYSSAKTRIFHYWLVEMEDITLIRRETLNHVKNGDFKILGVLSTDLYYVLNKWTNLLQEGNNFMPYLEWLPLTGRQNLEEVEKLLLSMKKMIGELEMKIKGGKESHLFYGLEVQGMTKDVADSFQFDQGYHAKGALVSKVMPGYGKVIGFMKNDIITKVNGRVIYNFVNDMLPLETKITLGTNVSFEILRAGKKIILSGPILLQEMEQPAKNNNYSISDQKSHQTKLYNNMMKSDGQVSQSQIYIFRNSQHFGPYSIEDLKIYLKNGSVLINDLVWHEGLPAWVPLTNIFDNNL